MRRILLYITVVTCICTVSITASYAANYGGYEISGTAYDNAGNPLKNITIYLHHKGVVIPIKTNEIGHYTANISWSISCVRRLGWRLQANKYNGRWIHFTYSDKTAKARNKWKKYRRVPFGSRSRSPYEKDLVFK